MKLVVLLLATIGIFAAAYAQDAAPSSVYSEPGQLIPPEPKSTPVPAPTLPELSTLDQGFQPSSIGKEADAARERVEIRRLQNRIANDPYLMAAKQNAEAAETDLGKRQRLRNYYQLYYGRLRSLTSDTGTKQAIADDEARHVKSLDQPRVRPLPDATVPPISKRNKTANKKKNSRLNQALSQH